MPRQTNKRKRASAVRSTKTSIDDSTAQSSLDESCRAAVKRVSSLAEAAFQTAVTMESLKQKSGKDPEMWDDVIRKMDDTLALMARNLSTYIQIRGKDTKSNELLFHIYGETLGSLERFSPIWKRCIETEADALSPDSPGYWLLSGLSNAVRLFQADCEIRPRLFQYWAEEQPCLPMLVFKHKTAYRKRFARLAESTRLGHRCPINVSERANYSLETPINDRVFEILMDYMHARSWIAFARERDPEVSWRKGATIEDQLAEQAHIPKKLQPVYFAAYDLPDLTKTTAHEWADVYVMPYLELSGCDFMTASEFAAVRRRKRVKSAATMRAEVRKDIVRSLVGMARPLAPKHRKGSAKP